MNSYPVFSSISWESHMFCESTERKNIHFLSSHQVLRLDRQHNGSTWRRLMFKFLFTGCMNPNNVISPFTDKNRRMANTAQSCLYKTHRRLSRLNINSQAGPLNFQIWAKKGPRYFNLNQIPLALLKEPRLTLHMSLIILCFQKCIHLPPILLVT